MKKRIVGILVLLMISVSICGSMTADVAVSAHGHHSGSHREGKHHSHSCSSGCGGYADANGDGVCDNVKYSIKYCLNGGKNHKSNPSCYRTVKAVKLKKPVRKGYVFQGWYTDKKCRNKVTAIKKWSTGKKTLYAKWKKK